MFSVVEAHVLPAVKTYKKKQQNSLPSLYLCNPKNVPALDTPRHQWTADGAKKCAAHCGQTFSSTS